MVLLFVAALFFVVSSYILLKVTKNLPRVYITDDDDNDTIIEKINSVFYDKNYYRIKTAERKDYGIYLRIEEERFLLNDPHILQISVWDDDTIRIAFVGDGTLTLRTVFDNKESANAIRAFFEKNYLF